MNNNAVKIVVLLVAVFMAYKSLSSGLKTVKRRPAGASSAAVLLPVNQEAIPPSDSTMPSVPEAPKEDTFDAVVEEYGRIPFMAPQTSAQKRAKDEGAAKDVAAADQGPVLTTIFQFEGKWYAIINKMMVKPGDKVGPVRILEIRKNHVKLEKDGQILKLLLRPETKLK